MKSKIIGVIILSLLSLTITACSADKGSTSATENSNANMSKNNTQTATDQNNPVEKAMALVAPYQPILLNKDKFIDACDGTNKLFEEFLNQRNSHGKMFSTTKFAVLDMDGDKMPEVVVKLITNNTLQYYAILHYMNDKVYGYITEDSMFRWLLVDGTFAWSTNSPNRSGVGKPIFKTDGYEINNLYHQNLVDGKWECFIGDKSVPKEYYDTLVEEHFSKKNIYWYDCYPDKISTMHRILLES